MSLLEIPSELLLDITDYFDTYCDLNAFIRTSRRLYYLLNSTLYMRDAQTGVGAALHWAARKGFKRTAQFSLAEGVGVDTVYRSRTLATRTAKPDPMSSFTPLQVAISQKHEDVARLLVEKSANIMRGYPEPLGKITPLHMASALGLVATILLLVEYGAKLQARDKCGQTALHYAVKPRRWYPKTQESVEATVSLLGKGAVFTVRDRDGRTPEDLSNRAIGLVGNTCYMTEVEHPDYVNGFRNLVPPIICCSKEAEENAGAAEWRIKRLLEAKRVTSVVEKLDKDLALRMEKSAIQQKAQKYQSEKNREQRAKKRKDASVREASRKEAERDLAESTLRASRELEERRKEKENIRLAEERRMERCTAVAIQWSHLRRENEMKKLALAESMQRRCFHSSTGRLKSKGGARCEECKEICRQQAYKCPDCASVICVQCHCRSRLSPGSL